MNILSASFSGLVLSFLLVPGVVLAADNSTGVIILEDKDNHSCSLDAPPTGTGATWQYELPNNITPCNDNTADEIAFSDLPSATTILLTDDYTCSQTLSADNGFWIKLKTIKKLTNTDLLELNGLYNNNLKTIVAPGLQLIDKGRFNQNAPIREKLSCVRFSVSSPEQLSLDVTVSPGGWSEGQPESASDFTCEGDTVIFGRKHQGDENEPTFYRCAVINPESPFKLTQREEYVIPSEKDSYYQCPQNKVMTGRKHTGDENKPTTYRCATIVNSQGRPINQTGGEWSAPMPENSSHMNCPDNQVMVGRRHEGDEEGLTRIRCANLTNTNPLP